MLKRLSLHETDQPPFDQSNSLLKVALRIRFGGPEGVTTRPDKIKYIKGRRSAEQNIESNKLQLVANVYYKSLFIEFQVKSFVLCFRPNVWCLQNPKCSGRFLTQALFPCVFRPYFPTQMTNCSQKFSQLI